MKHTTIVPMQTRTFWPDKRQGERCRMTVHPLVSMAECIPEDATVTGVRIAPGVDGTRLIIEWEES